MLSLPIVIVLFLLNNYIFNFFASRLILGGACTADGCWPVTDSPTWFMSAFTISRYVFIGLCIVSVGMSVYGLIIFLKNKNNNSQQIDLKK
jgi:hypothetical protein